MGTRRILIVDDEESLARALRINLEATGSYQVRTVNCGRAGLDAAREFKPDVMLLDLMMPDIDGTEVAAQLADDPTTSDIPIVFLTAVAQKAEVRAMGGVIGGRTFLAKPVEIGEVIETLQKVLSKRPTANT